jgi:hypothetical protein
VATLSPELRSLSFVAATGRRVHSERHHYCLSNEASLGPPSCLFPSRL